MQINPIGSEMSYLSQLSSLLKIFKYPSLFLVVFLIFSSISFAQSSGGGKSPTRGIDFRMQINKGLLEYTSISGVPRTFDGIGSELQTHIYLIERNYFRSTFFMSSRVMSYTGRDVLEGETDDLQTFSIAPGIELCYGIFYIQAAYQAINVNNYWISSFSSGKQYGLNSMSTAGGINYRFGHLGIGLGVTQVNMTVPKDKLGLSEDSEYKEISYSLNFIYYIGTPPLKFFKELFVSR